MNTSNEVDDLGDQADPAVDFGIPDPLASGNAGVRIRALRMSLVQSDVGGDRDAMSTVVTDRLGTPEGDAVSAAFHTLATDLDLDLTVEGVETADQAQALVAMGSVHGQGYWWSRPIQASDVAGYLDRHRRTHTDLDVVAVDRHPGDA
ncbi:EAL domain-containing protein [Rhodococcus sp. KRD162]|uniref:EAL domain-containing protein n=1 Tax=unclassified Rhodococcus (in: high G+C Gram-positive bacteria) TaxID=192944 RepID=UPI0019D2763D|nr:EAL domain-containing protein [Rhodococcus sp. KRD162]